MNFGGLVYAADSGLNEVRTIQNTGKKKTIPANQAKVDHAKPPSRSRGDRLGFFGATTLEADFE